jgi:hypothetical protein
MGSERIARQGMSALLHLPTVIYMHSWEDLDRGPPFHAHLHPIPLHLSAYPIFSTEILS